MKVIFICPSLERTYGWSRYTHDVVTRVAKSADVTVLCQTKVEGVHPAIKQLPVLRSAMTYLRNPLVVIFDAWRIRKILSAEVRNYSGECVIHCTTEAHAMFIPFFWRIKAKKLMTTHGTYSVLPLQSWKTRWLAKWMYRSIDRVVSVSHYTKKHLLKHAGNFLPAEKIFVVTNGVDFVERPKKIAKLDEVYRIIAVGEVKNRKGSHHLVRVAKVLKDSYNFPFMVTFIGKVLRDDPYFRDIQKFMKENELEKNITFTDMIPQEELDKHYQAADVFALLSVHENGHYEGYPLVFHEAAMWGLPTIGTFDCGAEDAIKDGITGVLVHPAHHEEVAEKIAALQSGKLSINPQDCQNWARENDWDKKDLLAMYAL